MTNKEKFKEAYNRGLVKACEAFKEKYVWYGMDSGNPPINLKTVANSMFEAIEKDRFCADSPAVRVACKELNIEPTREGVLDFWHS